MKFSKTSVVLRLDKNAETFQIEDVKKEAILSEKEEILDFNREELRHGIDSEGEKFGPYRSTKYAKWKQSLSTYKARYPTPDLYVTGNLQNQMDLALKGQKVDIYSRDPAVEKKIQGRFLDAFGISPNIASIVMAVVTDEFNKLSYNKLFA